MSITTNSPKEIQIPVIYPSILTKEQRDIIKRFFRYYEDGITCSNPNCENAEAHVDALLWLFGEEFFKEC